MKVQVFASDINPFSSNSTKSIIIKLPDKCPCCGIAYASSPFTTSYFESDEGYTTAYSTFFCPSCGECFFVSYEVEEDFNGVCGFPLKIYPTPETQTVFSAEIQTLSPSFVNIYNQSEQAENNGLHDICGIGYRKALEFLIKDYAISLNPDKQTEIESASLSACISTYINNEKIKTLASASAWSGNDETHYVRKHQNYNVQDLKRFINTVVAFIEYELNYTEALNLLSDPQ